MSRGHPEHHIQCAVADFLNAALPSDAFWSAVDLSDARDARTGALKKARGCRAGLPDIFIIWEGRFYGIEVKSATGRMSAAQIATASGITRAGGDYRVVTSSADAEAVLRDIGIPLNATHLPLGGGRAKAAVTAAAALRKARAAGSGAARPK